MRRVTLLSLVVVAVVAALAAWPAVAAAESPTPALYGGSSASPGAAGGGLMLKVGIPEDYDSMNPFVAWTTVAYESFRLNYNFLTWYDDNYNPVPDLAESWTTSADGKTWTFKIRSGVKWQDGQPLTAHDIAFTYNLIIDNELWAFYNYFIGVKRVTAPDDTTLVIECNAPKSNMLALYVPIVPAHIWSKVPKSKLESWPNMPTIGSGPFEVVETKKSRYVRLVANKKYFGGAPTLDSVLFNIYTNSDSMVADYKAGNLDAIYGIPAAQLSSLRTGPGWKAVNAPYIGYQEMGFNCWPSPKSKGNPLLLDYRIRLACSWAIDREKLIDAGMAGLAKPGNSVITPMSPYHWEPPADQLITYNPDKAKQILDQAGYVDRNGDGVRESPKGKKLDFRLVALTEYPEEVTAAKLIHVWLKDVGINTRLDIMSESVFTDLNAAGDFDIYLWNWNGDIDPDFMLYIFTTMDPGNWSDCLYSNPTFDKLYREQVAAVDPANPNDHSKRMALVTEMQKFLYQQSPYVILWYNTNFEAYRADKWTGWYLAPPQIGGPIVNLMRTTYIDLKPASATTQAQGGGTSPAVWIGLAVAVVVVVGLVVWLLRRRRPGAEEM